MYHCFSPKLFMADSLAVPGGTGDPQAWVWGGGHQLPASRQGKALTELQAARERHGAPRRAGARSGDPPVPGKGSFSPREASQPVEREEQAASPGNPSQERRRQDDSCLPVYSQLKSNVNQPGPLPAPCGGTRGRGAEEQPTRPSRGSRSPRL